MNGSSQARLSAKERPRQQSGPRFPGRLSAQRNSALSSGDTLDHGAGGDVSTFEVKLGDDKEGEIGEDREEEADEEGGEEGEGGEEDSDGEQATTDDEHSDTPTLPTQPHKNQRLQDRTSRHAPDHIVPKTLPSSKAKSVHLTISDDRSKGSAFETERRDLVALERRELRKNTGLLQAPSDTNPEPAPPHGNAIGVTTNDTHINFSAEGVSRRLMMLTRSPEETTSSYPKRRRHSPRSITNEGSPISSLPGSSEAAVPRMIDANILGLPEDATTSPGAFQAYLANLVRCSQLTFEPASRKKIIHHIGDGGKGPYYFDHPQWVFGDGESKALKSNMPVRSIDAYLERRPEIGFVVFRHYNPSTMKAPEVTDDEEGSLSPIGHTSEHIETRTPNLVAAFKKLSKFGSNNFKVEHGTVIADSISLSSPYLAIFHSREILAEFLATLPSNERASLQLLLEYILCELNNEYESVDKLLGKGTITSSSIEYLFKPGDLLLKGKGNDICGYLATSWLDHSTRPLKETAEMKRKSCWSIVCEHWDFDGVFSHRKTILQFSLDSDQSSELKIDELDVKPLRSGDQATETLRRRGEMFWKCRFRHFVSYLEDPTRDSSGEERFMIDLGMYRELHKRESHDKSLGEKEVSDDLGPQRMKSESPPDEEFLYLLPRTIKGYSLKRKKWLDLEVDKISEVAWNKDAFENLVLERKTKRLLQALVSNHLEAERGTDLIYGKGNGLILLLHGGQGTGKTLTAESVAEIAEKPLYPVTCGDIGTESEMVETYLESVLHLGKTWGCVVLLDEADVFLEQRSLEDLQRNALVSVFLRTLEYYDGILILTSNRVDTFDEAFKSRIQLALHYPNLETHHRIKIWENFIRRLQSLKENIDFSDLISHVPQLANHEMNGREIRNVITTARKYAMWEKERLDFEILEDIIQTTGRFNAYIKKLHGNHTQDELAEEDGLRLQRL
ncbi:uncharacterized protein E0L32_001657 [Thyridium curvatum]|uniref:AAA+ ATPase domain-containing protein n=1 Tax=Thyridium curvatum TaxID=1093900 RepID=A0A507AVZ0_9PEZI|nr:uncharacterized protein E0L32_001541 [Thyridium curvatum]XP_030990908.1 uncharacterized protein E0L32_001657 [Thyridium curvatum]TPX09081.1 hypothetical protein E0L32_001541 [Thyridium curvatum]TPX09197.1 hypothetical protein E0L32_001657 [Thyridium curvatum]